MVQLNPDVIVATASANALAAKMATSTIPIVVPALGNPVALGLIESYSHPGGNLTGIMPYVSGLPAKQLELAREIVPGALKIGIVNDPIDAKAMGQWDEINTTAAKLEIKIVRADVRKPGLGVPSRRLTAHSRYALRCLVARMVRVIEDLAGDWRCRNLSESD